MNKSSKMFIILIIFSIFVLITPIMAAHIFYFKNKVLWILGGKENAYQYLQFIGTFLGVIVTVLGTFIFIDRQMLKEKELQERILKQEKETDIQIKLRENIIIKIFETQKSIKSLILGNLPFTMFSETIINPKESGGNDLSLKFEKFNRAQVLFLVKPYEHYSNNMTDLIAFLEIYKHKLKNINYDFDILDKKDKAIFHSFSEMNLLIRMTSKHTLSTMKSLNAESKKLDTAINDLAKELTMLVEELNKY